MTKEGSFARRHWRGILIAAAAVVCLAVLGIPFLGAITKAKDLVVDPQASCVVNHVDVHEITFRDGSSKVRVERVVLKCGAWEFTAHKGRTFGLSVADWNSLRWGDTRYCKHMRTPENWYSDENNFVKGCKREKQLVQN